MNYYNDNAKLFFDSTKNVDMSKLYSTFFEFIPTKGEILDLGCGSGRDSKHFLKSGYQVTAIEPAQKLATLAKEYINQPVIVKKVEEIDYTDKFVGIWACASLLHIPFCEINNTLEILYKSLKANGVLFVSVKYGNKEENRNGRFFCDYTEDKFEKTLYKDIGFHLLEYSLSQDKRPGRENEKWLNIVLRK